MALYLNTNMASLRARRYLSTATVTLDNTIKNLSTGLRINSAKDDPAGLQIANRMTAQINGLKQGNRNAADGISIAQVAEGAMDEMVNMFQSIRTLAIQAANGTNTQADRNAIQQQISQYTAEINRIANKTTFNGKSILAGASDSNTITNQEGIISIQVGAFANDTIDIDLSQGYSFDKITTTILDKTSSVKLEVVDTTTGVYQNYSDEQLLKEHKISKESADKFFNENGQDLFSGYDQNNNTITINQGNIYELARGSIVDGSANNNILGMLFGIKANVSINNTTGILNLGFDFDVTTASGAQKVLSIVDKYINNVDGARATLGAIQNRFESVIRNQSNIIENTADARSRIMDTDYAEATANFAQQSIMQQVSASMLTLANRQSNFILSLLNGI